ncbi:MAG: acetoin utilization protein AcuC [Longimicrobiales bacterium]
MRRTALVWDDVLARYRFSAEHPLDPRRLELTVGLIRKLGLVGDDARPVVAPRIATDEEIQLAHDPAYIEAVKRASEPGAATSGYERFGLGTEDVPIVEGMHEAGALIVGATLTAAELVMTGRVTRAFSIAGGLHHARRAEAAGFCIYNDLAVAIRWMQREHRVRVLYVDVDAHHGDGVQWIFYDDPDVLKVSLHESGAYLFPGTGFVDEVGEGEGYGFTVNVPLDAHTEDDSFLQSFRDVVPEVAAAFRPDVLVMQCGCDAHVLDPLTHLRCTTAMYEEVMRLAGEVADEHCEGRIIATGGGGYAIHAVVPRAWALVWAGLCGVKAPDSLPNEWCKSVRLESGRDVPCTLRDPADAFPPAPRREEIRAINEKTVSAVRHRVLPLITGWGLAF